MLDACHGWVVLSKSRRTPIGAVLLQRDAKIVSIVTGYGSPWVMLVTEFLKNELRKAE